MYDRTRTLLTEHKEDVEKVAKLLLQKEVLTRSVIYILCCNADRLCFPSYREDMNNLLGKRPFTGREDDMDKWLDEHQKHGLAMPPANDTLPPPPPPVDDPLPTPAVAMKKLD